MDVLEDENFDASENRSSSTPGSDDSEELQAQIIVFYPNKTPIAYRLHAGVNVIGRRSSIAERDESRLKEWSEQFKGQSVHGVFLESSSVSSAHAAIYLEPWGDLCFVKDLKSRNKTFLKQSGHHKAIEPFAKCPLQSGGSLTFGALRCRISFGASFEGLPSIPSVPANVRRSSAVSISQLPPDLAEQMGSASLDKCPSLQEWFVYPSGSSPPGRRQSPPSDHPLRRPIENGPSDLSQRYSFGFNPQFTDQEDHTSSDAEPETPRIDKPNAFARIRSSKLSLQNSGLTPMMEDEKEGHDSDEMRDTPQQAQENDQPSRFEESEAKWIDNAREHPENAIPRFEQELRAHSPAASFTEEETEHSNERNTYRHASPLKRTRSGRQNSDSRPRSKSPRLQRGFAVREPSFRLEEMREAVSNIKTDA